MARPLQRNHENVQIRARLNKIEMHVKAVGKRQRTALLQVVLDVVPV